MNKKKIYQMIAKVALVATLMTGVSGVLPNDDTFNFLQAESAYAAEIGTVTVTASSLWTYSRADWNARIAVVSRGTKLTAVEKINVAGRDMYRLSNGRYVTANTAYVQFSPSGTTAPAPTAPSTTQTSSVKTTANLNMRSGSSTAYGILSTIPKGTTVPVVGHASKGWYQVTYNGKTGYVSNSYVSVVSGTTTPAPAPSVPSTTQTSYVRTTASLNMRSGSSTAYKVLLVIPSGTTVPVSGRASNGWYQVTYAGKTGYVSNSYVQTVASYSEKTIKVPYINQYAPLYAPMGCEGASLLMAMQYKNYTNVNLKTFLDNMPKTARNPFAGFSSTPYEVVKGNPPIFQSIFPEALTKYGRNYNSNVFDLSGYTTEQLKGEIDKGNPVVVYVTTRNFETPKWEVYDMGEAGNVNIVGNMHVMLLTGYNSNGEYQVADPANSKQVYWVSKAKFETAYNALKWAVVAR